MMGRRGTSRLWRIFLRAWLCVLRRVPAPPRFSRGSGARDIRGTLGAGIVFRLRSEVRHDPANVPEEAMALRESARQRFEGGGLFVALSSVCRRGAIVTTLITEDGPDGRHHLLAASQEEQCQ